MASKNILLNVDDNNVSVGRIILDDINYEIKMPIVQYIRTDDGKVQVEIDSYNKIGDECFLLLTVYTQDTFYRYFMIASEYMNQRYETSLQPLSEGFDVDLMYMASVWKYAINSQGGNHGQL